MRNKRNKEQVVATPPISEEEGLQNIMKAPPSTEKPNRKHKFIWDPKKRRLPLDIEDKPVLAIRSEDIQHS
ncbi:MAG: hypothetical protein AMJ75_02300 [Phycisphaerae bacterium SM1_79]|nr:MAG: hypothetical protein AMJ75_02300 [Phycisphaerae bacterium SM1_79]